MSRTPTSKGPGPGAQGRGASAHGSKSVDSPPSALGPRPSALNQEGFTLAALIVILTIMAMFVAFTVPDQWSMVLKRERDRQTIFLMKQFARGIYGWQAKHNQTAPVSLEQLQEAKKPRLLRGTKWPMPLTGKEEDWILVPPQALVQNITPAAGGQPVIGPDGRPVPQQQPQPQLPGETQQPAMRLNKDLSPPDYKGPFVAVRPKATGQSFIALNGMENYEEWVYTVQDLMKEIEARRMALAAR
jgi:type II secretory pathway pseudopilin PulG